MNFNDNIIPTGLGRSRSPKRDNNLQLQGPRPTPLRINKESHKINKKPPLPPPRQQQQQQPVIIYTVSPKIIHTTPSDFMSLVQRLTGSSSSSSSSNSNTHDPNLNDNIGSGTTSIEREQQHQRGNYSTGDVERPSNMLPPPPPPSSFFSPPATSDPSTVSFLRDLRNFMEGGNFFMPSPNSNLVSPNSNIDLFNNFSNS